ncbi:hypothetical protein PMZ80_009782 [Knufia obscura]|uniref:CID domain-containing protein n=1 Tax=Knufia obscura TaxID=1635080 RepID=A0ABR0RD58_9EURO|nr:hypothetical protein PMZ80_009782 [Knufia obscura]
MSAHGLSIAKATLLASCLRPDVTKVSRDDLTTFHTLLEASICTCTPANIQSTKSWLLQHILPSSLRSTAFSKYLAILSKNVATLPQDSSTRSCRRQLHVLYILNDIFHHVKYHGRDEKIQRHAREQLSTSLAELFASAAAEKKSRTTKRLNDLVQIWGDEGYCDRDTLARLREALSGTAVEVTATAQPETKASKELPWIMPATHGDPAAPFFDLPAANLMPHIVPNSSRPMRPDKIRAIQLPAGPADDGLVQAMKDFLKDVKSIDDPYAALEDEGIVADIDEMGQISYKNEAGDLVGDTCYGWSRSFCENMKKSRGGDNSAGGRGRSRSRGSSRSSSRSPRKRRRYSSSGSRSRSYSRSPSPQRVSSRDRKPSIPRTMHARTYSPEPPRFPSRLQGQQPPPPPPPQQFSQPPQPSYDSASTFQHHQQPQSASMPLFQPPPGLAGMIPPRPANWSGPWPPPPPPPGAAGFPGPFPNMSFPPPPPPNYNHQGYGRH